MSSEKRRRSSAPLDVHPTVSAEIHVVGNDAAHCMLYSTSYFVEMVRFDAEHLKEWMKQ